MCLALVGTYSYEEAGVKAIYLDFDILSLILPYASSLVRASDDRSQLDKLFIEPRPMIDLFQDRELWLAPIKKKLLDLFEEKQLSGGH